MTSDHSVLPVLDERRRHSSLSLSLSYSYSLLLILWTEPSTRRISSRQCVLVWAKSPILDRHIRPHVTHWKSLSLAGPPCAEHASPSVSWHACHRSAILRQNTWSAVTPKIAQSHTCDWHRSETRRRPWGLTLTLINRPHPTTSTASNRVAHRVKLATLTHRALFPILDVVRPSYLANVLQCHKSIHSASTSAFGSTTQPIIWFTSLLHPCTSTLAFLAARTATNWYYCRLPFVLCLWRGLLWWLKDTSKFQVPTAKVSE